MVDNVYYINCMLTVATAEDSPIAMKLKKMWLKTPVGEEQAAQAIMDPSIGKYKPDIIW